MHVLFRYCRTRLVVAKSVVVTDDKNCEMLVIVEMISGRIPVSINVSGSMICWYIEMSSILSFAKAPTNQAFTPQQHSLGSKIPNCATLNRAAAYIM